MRFAVVLTFIKTDITHWNLTFSGNLYLFCYHFCHNPQIICDTKITNEIKLEISYWLHLKWEVSHSITLMILSMISTTVFLNNLEIKSQDETLKHGVESRLEDYNTSSDAPVGRWTTRTALSVVLTLCPPAPRDLNVSIRRSLAAMWMSTWGVINHLKTRNRTKHTQKAIKSLLVRSDITWLRQHDDRHGSRVNALHAWRQTHFRNPLDPVRPALELQPAVHRLTGDPHGRVMETTWRHTANHQPRSTQTQRAWWVTQPTVICRSVIEELKVPLFIGGEALVHVKHLSGELLADVAYINTQTHASNRRQRTTRFWSEDDQTSGGPSRCHLQDDASAVQIISGNQRLNQLRTLKWHMKSTFTHVNFFSHNFSK